MRAISDRDDNVLDARSEDGEPDHFLLRSGRPGHVHNGTAAS